MLKKSAVIFERKSKKEDEHKTEKNNKQKSGKKAEEIIHKEIYKAQEIVFRCKTRFPFDIFPDIISLDTEKITVQSSYFFLIGEAKTYEITTIKTIITDDAFFFSTVSLYGDDEKKPLLFLKNLSHTNARMLYDLIRGILQAKKSNVELNDIPQYKLFNYLMQLGKLYT